MEQRERKEEDYDKTLEESIDKILEEIEFFTSTRDTSSSPTDVPY